MIRVRVLFFGPARDLTGASSAEFELSDGATVGEVHASLAADFDLRLPVGWRVAVNRTFARENHPLADGDEVAVIPPVSGG